MRAYQIAQTIRHAVIYEMHPEIRCGVQPVATISIHEISVQSNSQKK